MQEISQWLYGQHWVSCSSPAARAAPGPDRASPGPSRTPAAASQQRLSNKSRLEGLCPGGVIAERGGLLCRAGWVLLRSRAVPGDILPCTGGCPSSLLLHSCLRAGHLGIATGISLAPSGLTEVLCAGMCPGSAPFSGAQHPLLLLPASHHCPGPWELPHCGHRGDIANGQDRTGAAREKGLVPAGVGDMAALPLGSSPVHGRGGTAVYSFTLPPSQHHPHRPQLPRGLEHSPCCFQYDLQGCLQWAGRVVSASQTRRWGRRV